MTIHGFTRHQDMSPTHDSNQVFLPGGTTIFINSAIYLRLAPRPYLSPLSESVITFMRIHSVVMGTVTRSVMIVTDTVALTTVRLLNWGFSVYFECYNNINCTFM